MSEELTPTPATDALMEADYHGIEEYTASLSAYRRMCSLSRAMERERDKLDDQLHAVMIRLGRTQERIIDLQKVAKHCERLLEALNPKSIASALWDNSTLRHGMFTPPEFSKICCETLERYFATLKGGSDE